VEKIEDLRTLIELGCHSAQGYLFARPMDPVSFINMLRGHSAESSRPRDDLSDDAPEFHLTADARLPGSAGSRPVRQAGRALGTPV
jgi:hypothetical protein